MSTIRRLRKQNIYNNLKYRGRIDFTIEYEIQDQTILKFTIESTKLHQCRAAVLFRALPFNPL